MIDGGPSVLFDAVALLTSDAAIDDLVNEATARDFVADAFQHCKFIGYDLSASPLLEKAGIADKLDEGVISLPGEDGLAAFVTGLGKLRVWAREPSLKLGKLRSLSKKTRGRSAPFEGVATRADFLNQVVSVDADALEFVTSLLDHGAALKIAITLGPAVMRHRPACFRNGGSIREKLFRAL